MEPEIIIGALALFVSGGAMGAAGILLSQWVVGKMAPPQQRRLHSVDTRDMDVMKADLADLAVQLHSVDARLDFTEQLLGGALSGTRPPDQLPTRHFPPAQRAVGLDADASPDADSTSPDRESTSR